MLELSRATLLLLDEPTDNLDLHSAEALEEGLAVFDRTVWDETRAPVQARTHEHNRCPCDTCSPL
nr:hypothetical protein [Austwickia chelonae]